MSTKTVPQVIREYRDEYVECRDLGHSWCYTKVTLVKNKRGKIRGYLQHLSCGSCTTERRRWINPDGSLGNNYYSYPLGYLIPKELKNAFDSIAELRMAIRVEQLDRLKSKTVTWHEEGETETKRRKPSSE